MKRNLFILAFLVGITMLLAQAYDLEQMKQRALELNPGLKSATETTRASWWDYQQAVSRLFPSANYSFGYTRMNEAPPAVGGTTGSPENTSLSHSVTITQPIYQQGRNWGSLYLSEDAAYLQEAALMSQRLNLLTNVETGYLDVLLQKELLTNAERSLEAARKHLEAGNIRLETGTIARGEYYNMLSDAANKEVALIQQQNLYRISRINFANMVQLEGNYELVAVDTTWVMDEIEQIKSFGWDRINGLVDDIVRTGLESNLDIQQTRLSLKMKETTETFAMTAFVPALSVSYTHSWSEGTDPDEDYDETGTLMLNASLPILPFWDNYSGLKSAKRDTEAARWTLSSVEDNIRMGLESAVYNLVSAAQSVHAARVALDFARETYRQQVIRFESNLTSPADLLDSEVLLNASLNQYTNSIYTYLKNRAQLLQMMGVEDDSELETLLAKM